MLKKGLYMLLGASLFGMGLLFTNFAKVIANSNSSTVVYAGQVQASELVIYDPGKSQDNGYIKITPTAIHVMPSVDYSKQPEGVTKGSGIGIYSYKSAPEGSITEITAAGVYVGKVKTETITVDRVHVESDIRGEATKIEPYTLKGLIGELDTTAMATVQYDSETDRSLVIAGNSDNAAALRASKEFARHYTVEDGDQVWSDR